MDVVISPLLAAIFIFTSVFLTGLALYTFAEKLLPDALQSLVQDYTKTLIICAYPFGHAVVVKFYGPFGFLVVLVPLMVVTIISLPKGEASPVHVWVKYFRGVLPLWSCVLKTVVQLGAGLTAYRLGMALYQTELHQDFTGRIQGTCNSALNVPVYQGFLIETLGVIYDTWFITQKLSNNPLIDLVLKITNTGIVVMAGFRLTGMFIHPSKATGHTFGCGETPVIAHLFVYWLGPLLGAWLCARFHDRTKLQLTEPIKQD